MNHLEQLIALRDNKTPVRIVIPRYHIRLEAEPLAECAGPRDTDVFVTNSCSAAFLSEEVERITTNAQGDTLIALK